MLQHNVTQVIPARGHDFAIRPRKHGYAENCVWLAKREVSLGAQPMPRMVHPPGELQMPENPYDSPVAPPIDAAHEPQNERGQRPMGIWILSGLHVLVGVVFLAVAIALQVAAALGVEDATGPIEADRLLTLLFGALAAYAIVSGVGLWRGDRWGWWLSAFYWVGMAMNWIGEGSVTVWKMRHEDVTVLAGVAVIVFVRMLFHIFLVLYHFKHSVRNFFGLQSLRMLRTIAILAGIGIAIGVAVGFAVFLFTISNR